MSKIDYKQPELINEPIEGKSFPYNQVSDSRRFEELIYSIYKIKIARNEFQPYDSISIMNGSKEGGRDCTLLKGGKNYGVIQCKKHGKSLNKEQFGKEITKFVLHSLLEPGLISDTKEFEYFIAVAGGMTNECINFIDEFNHQILTEPRLTDWIDENLQSPTLSPLKINEPSTKVLQILALIKVRKIVPQDLDILLAEPSMKDIVPLFFKVREVTDNSHIIELKEEFQKFANKRLGKEDIEAELKIGSGSLRSQSNEIEAIPDSHIERPEMNQLLNWVISTAEKDKNGNDKNICLLAGDAGIGKTVILKDLYDELANQNRPVLALKADKLYPVNMQDLQLKINLSVPVFDFIEQCKQHFDTTTILIDQIDALSQSMSSDRNYLHIFRQLIDNFVHDPNIRIIISVRTFDLEYDPSLKIYKDIKVIKVGLLGEAEVKSQLAKIKFPNDLLSLKLLQLLRTPNHLNIFSIVYAKRTGADAAFSTIQELYSELWLQKIITPANSDIQPEQLKSVLFRIAHRIFKEQRISVSREIFEDVHKEILYLESERILKVEDKQVQFFHQSFYDYVFAKDFVENGESLQTYIKNQRQTILIRSAVKMIVNYLRVYNHNKYIQETESLLKSTSIFFHVKHLLLSLLSVVEEPSEQEKALFVEYILPSGAFKIVFFEHIYGRGWTETVFKTGVLDFLIEPAMPKKANPVWKINFAFRKLKARQQDGNDDHLRHVCQVYLRNQLAIQNDAAFNFVLMIKDQDLLRWLSFTLDNWSHPKAIELFKKCKNFDEIDPYGYFSSLEHLIPSHPDFVFEQVRHSLFSEDYYDESNRNHDYYNEKKVIKDLTLKVPFTVVGELLKNLDAQINNPRLADVDFNGDYKYKDIYLQEEPDTESPALLYKLLAVSLWQAAVEGNDIFKSFVKNFKNDINKSYLRLFVFAYDADVKKYAGLISDLFHHLHSNGLIKDEGKLNVEFRNLFEKGFPHFSADQKKKALELIMHLHLKDELHVYQREGVKHKYFTWGLTQYFFLKRLPAEVFIKDKELKKRYQELDRKWHHKTDKLESRSSIAKAVRRPFSDQAYSKMSPDQWIKSFKKYDNDNRNWGDDYLKGGLHEHSWGFQEFIGKNATKANVDLVARVVHNDDINSTYKIRGIYGLTEAQAAPELVLPLVEYIIAKKQFNNDQSLFLSSIGYLFQMDCNNDDLVNYALNEAIDGEIPKQWAEKELHKETSVNGLIMAAVNSSKGKAAEYLCFVTGKKYEETIFQTLDQLLARECPQVRAVIYYRYAYLMRMNGERAFNLFVKHLSKEKNEEVIASSIWSLQYMANYDFDRLEPILKKLVETANLGDEDSRGISTIIFISYLKGKSTAKKIYTDFLTRSSKRHFWAIYEALEYFYLFDDSPQKCLEILHLLLVIAKPEKETKELNFQFYKLENIKFRDIKSFLLAYIESKFFKMSDELTKYLITSCNDEPFDCVDLFSLAISQKEKTKKEDHYRTDDHATQFIIAGFNAIKDNDKRSKKYRKKLLKTFDNVLSDIRFRKRSERILDAL